MVATSRSRKNAPSTEADHRTGMVCTSGGRRHILGLAKAIREKAFQSTTPLSEKNHNLSARHGKREHVSDPQLQRTNNNPTVEERLKNLFNSDTEELEEKHTRPHASSSPILPPYRSTTPGPYFDLQQRRTMSARPKSANQANNMGRNDRKTACELSNQIISNQGVLPTQPRNETVVVPKRCASAVPPNFHSNWSHAHEQPSYMPMSVAGALTPSPEVRVLHQGVHAMRVVKTSPSPNYEVHRAKSLAPERLQPRTVDPPGRPIPATRKSLVYENVNSTGSQHLVMNRRYNSSAPPAGLTGPDYAKPPPGHYTVQHELHHSTSHLNSKNYESRNQVFVSQQPRRNFAPRKTLSLPGAYSKGDNKQLSLNQADPRQATSDNTVPDAETPLPSASLKFSPGAYPLNVRPCYPHVNFSFRRAVHRSPSSESPVEPTCDIRRSTSCKTENRTQNEDRDHRKSDDRDSGAVLEPDASVLDLDSSDLSEEANGEHPVRYRTSVKSSQVARAPHKEPCSRSSTPLLPPLPFENDGKSAERNAPTVPEAASPVIPSNSSKRLEQSSSSVPTLDSKGGGAELSPTESAISAVKAKQLEQRSQTKVISSKVQRGPTTARRGLHSKALTSEEQTRRKHRHRSYYDESDLTDWSQQHETYKLPYRRRGHSAYYSRSSAITIDASELGETSSVRSVTTTSVCSGALRKSSRRRRSYFNRAAGAERYSREIRLK